MSHSHVAVTSSAEPAAERTTSRILFVTLLLAMVGPTLVLVTLPPSLPLIAAYFGGGEAGQSLAQMAQSSSFAGLVLGGVVAGSLIRLIGLRPILLMAAGLYATGGGIAMSATVGLALFGGCFLVGLCGAFLSSGLAMATGREMVGDARTRILGFQTALSDVAAVTIGLMAGGAAQIAGWRAPLATYVLFGVLALLLIYISRPEAPVDENSRNGGMAAAIRGAWPVYLASVLISVFLSTQQLQLPFHLAAHGLVTTGERALVQTGGTAAATLSSLTFGYTQALLGDRKMLLVSGSAGALGFAMFGLWTGGLLPALGASACIGLALGIAIPLLFKHAMLRTPPVLHAYSVGALNVTIGTGGAVSPLVLSPIFKALGIPVTFFFCSAIALAGAATCAWVLKSSGATGPERA